MTVIYDIILIPNSKFENEKQIENKIKNEKELKIK